MLLVSRGAFTSPDIVSVYSQNAPLLIKGTACWIPKGRQPGRVREGEFPGINSNMGSEDWHRKADSKAHFRDQYKAGYDFPTSRSAKTKLYL